MDDDVDRVRQATNLVQIIGQHVELRQKGREHVGLCPFHNDHTPSMSVVMHKKQPFYKCHSCGAGGDVFKFVMDYHGMAFADALAYLADRAGVQIRRRGKYPVPAPSAAPVQRESAPTRKVETMTAAEVREAYKHYKGASLPPDEWADRIGVSPQAMTMTGAVAAKVGSGTALVMPMRNETGELTSLRFRDYATKKRWSIDVKGRDESGEMVQMKSSVSGLMSTPDFFDPDITIEYMTTIVVEGETDLLAGLTMMLKSYGSDTVEWPARWVALPGVNTCHDLLIRSRLTPVVMMFFDDDRAGHDAVFDRRPSRRKKDEIGNDVLGDDGKPLFERDMDSPHIPGLLRKLSGIKIQGLAAFPPKKDGSNEKFDLRDMVKSGWTWRQFDEHCRRTGTADPFGLKKRRARANGH